MLKLPRKVLFCFFFFFFLPLPPFYAKLTWNMDLFICQVGSELTNGQNSELTNGQKIHYCFLNYHMGNNKGKKENAVLQFR